MKSLVEFINEDKKYSEKDLYDIIADTLLDVDNIELEDDDEDERYAVTEEKIDNLKNIIKNFVKGHKTITVETSTLDYWEDFIDFPLTQNDAVEEETDILPDEAEWLAMDIFSLVVKDNVMYVSSQTGAPVNGDYFNFKITLG